MRTPVRNPLLVAPFAVLAFVAAANAQEPAPGAEAPAPTEQAANASARAPRIRLIELTPHLAVNDAAALIEAENYSDAIALLEDFNANQPEPVPEAYYLLALARYQLGGYAEARLPAERAATLAPDAPVSWLELVADILKRMDNPRAAIPWLHKLIEKAPTNKTYWLELSLAYERVGDIENSLATMRLAQGQNLLSEDAEFRRLSDLLLARGLPQQSAAVLEQALAQQIVRGDEAAYTKLGTAWFTAGEPARAIAPLENAARIANSGDGYVRLANVHITQRNWTAAIAALHAAMGRGSLTDPAHASLLMGVALYAQGKYAEARGYLATAAESERHRGVANEYLEAIEAATSDTNAPSP
jgi:tetratricopeptide (TPR) repeat protein